MTQHPQPPARKLLVASLSAALGLSLAGATGAAAAQSDTQSGISSSPAGLSRAPASVMPSQDLRRDMDYDLSNSPIAYGLASGELDQQAQRALIDRLRAEDELVEQDATIAATHVVTNCNDAGPGSLRSAINMAGEGDIVDLSDLGCSEITLESKITIARNNLTLRGELVWNSASEKYVPSTVIAGHTANTAGLLDHVGTGTLRLEKLGLQKGNKVDLPTETGGACVSSSGNIALLETRVKYCTAQRESRIEGGALYAAGDVTLTRSQIRNSEAQTNTGFAYGGGIYAGGRLSMTDSALSNNAATSPDQRKGTGGGAVARGGTMLRRAEINGNEAPSVGGILLEDNRQNGGDVYIKHTLVHKNKSTYNMTGWWAGGALISTSGEVYLANNTFTANSAARNTRGGLFVDKGTLTMVSNLISGNYLDHNGSRLDSDFWTSTAIAGSNNLIGSNGSSSGLYDPPADTIRQTKSPMIDNKPAKGSWAFNRGTFTAQIAEFDIQPPGCRPLIDPDCTFVPIYETDTDQSGAPRTVGAGTDIGALESDALFVDGFNLPPRPWAG